MFFFFFEYIFTVLLPHIFSAFLSLRRFDVSVFVRSMPVRMRKSIALGVRENLKEACLNTCWHYFFLALYAGNESCEYCGKKKAMARMINTENSETVPTYNTNQLGPIALQYFARSLSTAVFLFPSRGG